jgi:hypothetical protein
LPNIIIKRKLKYERKFHTIWNSILQLSVIIKNF